MDKKTLFNKLVAFITSVNRITHEFSRDAKSDIITPVQFNILEYIAVTQPVTLSQISQCQDMSMPNASRELKKLTENNLIEKIDDIDDRRKQFIRLSKDGEIMMNEAFKHIEAKFLSRIKDVSEEDLEDIYRALDILHSKLFFD